jgi:hypothetical protein
LAVVVVAMQVVAVAQADRLTDNEMQAQHRLHRMQATLIKEPSRALEIRVLCQKLQSVVLKMDATLVAVHIDMRLVLVVTAVRCL